MYVCMYSTYVRAYILRQKDCIRRGGIYCPTRMRKGFSLKVRELFILLVSRKVSLEIAFVIYKKKEQVQERNDDVCFSFIKNP